MNDGAQNPAESDYNNNISTVEAKVHIYVYGYEI